MWVAEHRDPRWFRLYMLLVSEQDVGSMMRCLSYL